MSQAPIWSIPAVPPSPIDQTTARLINSLNALLTGHSGASRPSYITTAGEGFWLKYVISPAVCEWYWYDGAQDIKIGSFDVATNVFTVAGGIAGAAAGSWGPEANIAVAATTNLGSVEAYRLLAIGGGTITSFGSTPNLMRLVRFSGALGITHNATTLILPGATDIIVAAGDMALLMSDASGNWRMVDFMRASGAPLFIEGEAVIAGAATVNLGSKRNMFIQISSAATITSFGTTPFMYKIVRMPSGAVLTHHATSLILPTGANITTTLDDVAGFYSDASGNWRCAWYMRKDGSPLAGGGGGGLPSYPGLVNNLEISCSVASGALTIALKTAAGADPSGGDPITAVFHAGTLGTQTTRTITAAMSLTIPNGGHLGASQANEAFRIWIVLFDDAGTLRLGIVNARLRTTNSIRSLRWNVNSSVILGTPTNAHTFYTAVAIASATPFLVLGWVEYQSGLATPGNYASTPTIIHLQKLGDPLPGDVIQLNYGSVTAESSHANLTYTATNLKITHANLSAANIMEVIITGAIYMMAASGSPSAVFARLHKDGAVVTTVPAQELYLSTGASSHYNISSGGTAGILFPGDTSSHVYEMYSKTGLATTTVEYPEQAAGDTVGSIIGREIMS